MLNNDNISDDDDDDDNNNNNDIDNIFTAAKPFSESDNMEVYVNHYQLSDGVLVNY